MAQAVKHLPAMWETRVRSLGREGPLEKGMATHSSILAWRVPMDRGAWWAAVRGVAELDATEGLHFNTGVGCHFLLQGSSSHRLHWHVDILLIEPQGSPLENPSV